MTHREHERERIIEASLDLTRRGLHSEHERLMRSAIQQFPNDPEISIRMAMAIIDRSLEQAKSYLRRAVELAPDDPYTLTRVGTHMFSAGEFEEAREYAWRAKRLAPRDFEFGPSLLHLFGKLAAQEGNDVVAEKLLAGAFQLEPETADHGLRLAEFYAERGRTDEALRVAVEALYHSPGDEWLMQVRDDLQDRC